MASNAEQLLNSLLEPMYRSSDQLRKIQTALDAAEQRGREQQGTTNLHRHSHQCSDCYDMFQDGLSDGRSTSEVAIKQNAELMARLQETKCHDPALCPDCAALVEKGREELRQAVLGEGTSRYKGRREFDLGYAYDKPVSEWDCLQPSKQAVQEWWEKWYKDEISTEGNGMVEAYHTYLKARPQPDAERIAEAVCNVPLKHGPYGLCRDQENITAAIKKALEEKR